MDQNNNKHSKVSGVFHFAGYRFWTFILLPALVGTTLPFWHDPPGFSFKWFVAIEFLIAAVLFYSGFSYLHAGFGSRISVRWTKTKLLSTGTILLLASLPLVVSTGLWIWVSELISRADDEKTEKRTTVMLFSQRFSARYLTLLLILLVYGLLILAVIGRSSLNPLSLVALFSVVLAVSVIHISWKEYNNIIKMRRALHNIFLIHIVIGTVIILSSLSSLIIKF